MRIKVLLVEIIVMGALLIFLGCKSNSTEPEGSDYTISTWIDYSNWTQASPPTISDSALHYYSQIGQIVWYNPFDKVLINDIWPSRDVNAQTGRTTDVLTLKFEPNLTTGYSWNGIMRTYPKDEPSPVDTGYFEIWILSDTGKVATLHIDLGKISEDWWLLDSNHMGQPSLGYLNTEDINFNGITDDGEDTGVDGTPFSDQPSDWPDDRWGQPDRNTNNYDRINGTEGNISVRGPFPDSEDINLNGILDLTNDYFEYKFSLDKASPDTAYIDSMTTKGWNKYKIPLNNPYRIIGNPSLLDVEFVRIWIEDVSGSSINIYIAQIKFTE